MSSNALAERNKALGSGKNISSANCDATTGSNKFSTPFNLPPCNCLNTLVIGKSPPDESIA